MKHLPLAALALSAVLGWASQSHAAPIVWSDPTTIAEDIDVSTDGTLLYAARYYASTGVSLTINGVTFTDPGSNVTWGGPTQNTGASPAGVTGDYNTFLGRNTYASSSNSSSGTLTLNGLTSGNQYLVQLWCNDSRSGALNQVVTFTAGNAVSLDRNTTGNAGIGQWVVGMFTADAATQEITVSNSLNQGLALNGLQVRALSAGGYDSWATTHEVLEGENGDDDKDGIINLVEYALGLDPQVGNPAPGTFTGNILTFTKGPEAKAALDVTYKIETSTTLDAGSWTTAAATETTDDISFELPADEPGGKLFARLQITKP
jgi:hypothetical protein